MTKEDIKKFELALKSKRISISEALQLAYYSGYCDASQVYTNRLLK